MTMDEVEAIQELHLVLSDLTDIHKMHKYHVDYCTCEPLFARWILENEHYIYHELWSRLP